MGMSFYIVRVYSVIPEPAVVLVLRGMNAFRRLNMFLYPQSGGRPTGQVVSLDKLMSPTVELAYRQVNFFFQASAGLLYGQGCIYVSYWFTELIGFSL